MRRRLRLNEVAGENPQVGCAGLVLSRRKLIERCCEKSDRRLRPIASNRSVERANQRRRDASTEENIKGAMVRVCWCRRWKRRMEGEDVERGWSVRETGEEGRKNGWCLRVE